MMSVMERYSRQVMLPEIGVEGQEALRRAKVLVVGAGGLGSPVALYLVGAGVGCVGLMDSDVVGLSNLQRQILYDELQLGQAKVNMAARRLHALNGEVQVDAYSLNLDAGNAEAIISGYDVVMDCCDNYPTRYLIDDTCYRLGKPWVHGGIGEMCGRVSVFNHRQGRRFEELYVEREYLCSLPRGAGGVIGPVAGVVGAMQACEAIKIIIGMSSPLDGAVFTIDMRTMLTNIIEI